MQREVSARAWSPASEAATAPSSMTSSASGPPHPVPADPADGRERPDDCARSQGSGQRLRSWPSGSQAAGHQGRAETPQEPREGACCRSASQGPDRLKPTTKGSMMPFPPRRVPPQAVSWALNQRPWRPELSENRGPTSASTQRGNLDDARDHSYRDLGAVGWPLTRRHHWPTNARPGAHARALGEAVYVSVASASDRSRNPGSP